MWSAVVYYNKSKADLTPLSVKECILAAIAALSYMMRIICCNYSCYTG